ncbi:MAG: hypothetical protein EBX40_06685, partial [Gammaproteobacteria bacterium]|nr:hypothetical protein [Gammaproteobacteria bacterium]
NYPSNWRDYEPTIQRACELVSDPIFPFWQQGALVRYVSRISSLVVSEGVILPTEPSSGKTLKEAPESLAIAANQKNTFYTVNVLNGDIALIKQDNFYAIEIKNLSVDCQLKQHKHHHGHNPSISLFTLKISGRMAVSLTADESGAYQAHFANPPVYEICAMSSKREGLDLLNAIFHHNNLLEAKPELIPEKAITITQEEIINKEKVMRSYDVVRTSTVITAPENLDVQSFLRYLYSFTVDQTEMEAIRALKAALKQYVKGGPRHHHVREAESALEALSAISFIQEGLKSCLEKVAKALPIAPSPTGEMAKKIKPLLNALVAKTGAPSVTVESELKDFQAEFLKLCDLFRKLGLQPEEFNTPPQPNSLSWVASKFDELQKHAYILSEPELHAAYQDLYKCLITQYSKDSRTLLEIFHALRKRTPFSNYYRFSIENDNRRFLTQLERLKNDSSIKLTYELEITPPARSPIAELPRDSDESDEERAKLVRERDASTPRSVGSLSGFHTPIAPSPLPLDESHEGASTTIERRTVLSRKSMASARSKAYSRAQRFDDGSATILVITACAPSPIS